MIDLQWQSLSLRRAFLLRSVCLSVRLTVESRPVCWPTHSKNQSKNTAKIDRRSIPGDAPGHPKSTQNRSRDHLGRPRVVQEHPEGVLGASRERHRASPALSRRARRVTKGDPARQKVRPGAPGSAPRRPKSTPSRIRERKNRAFCMQRIRKALSKRFFVDFRRFSLFRRSLRTLESAAPASKNRGSALRAPSRVARAMQPRKTTKIGPKIEPKSSKIASRGRSGDLFNRLWSLEAARSSNLERLGATRATRRATRSDQVGRSGSVGVGRVGQVARPPPEGTGGNSNRDNKTQ